MTKIKEALDENLSDEDLAKSAGGLSESAQISLGITVALAAV